MQPPRRAAAPSPRPRASVPLPTDPSRGGAWLYDAATGETQVSAGAARLIGAEGETTVGDFFERLPVDGAGRRQALTALRRCLKSGGEFDLRLHCAPGQAAETVRLVGGALGGAGGAVRALAGALLETDQEHRLAQELATRSAHVRSILETALDGMVVIDVHGRIQAYNGAARRLFGYEESETAGRNVSMLMAEPDRSRHDAYMSRYMTTGEKRIIGIGRIVTGQRKDGSQFPLHLAIGEVSLEGQRLFTGFMHDMTEERRSESRMQALQAELAHISRLSALGEMGSALAHELNQPLAAVGNYITGSRRLLADVEGPTAAKVESALARAAEQVLRAGQIIRRLRDFVSRRAAERRPESLAKLIEEASALGLVGAREKGVTLKYKLDAGCDAVHVDRIQIEQVLVNLLRNGLDAMDGAERRELTVSSGPAAPGLVEVAVADTGSGISPDALARLFDAFFTTKAAGLGVGLSISRGIVEAHGGEMRAENNEHGGATFRFTLPLRGEAGT